MIFSEQLIRRKHMAKYFELVFDKKFKEADEVRLKELPNTLYKYVPLEGKHDADTFNALQNDSLWLSKAFLENDPYEFKGLCMDREKLELTGISKEVLDFLEKNFSLSEKLVIGCLSKNDYQNAAMWGHYTNNWKGFCIEYTVENPNGLHEVIYNQKIISNAALYLNTLEALKMHDENEIELCARIFKENACIKSSDWSWENEYRILYPYCGSEKVIYVNHKKLGLKVSKIISGYRCSEYHRKKLQNICEKIKSEYGHANIRKYEFGIDVI